MKDNNKLPKVTFEINGKSVTRSNWDTFGPDITEKKLDAIADSIFKRIGNLFCEQHKKKADVLCKGTTIDNLEFHISGCCSNFTQQIIQQLKDLRPSHSA